MGSFRHVEKGLRYANDVVAGKIVAGLFERLACERQLRDLDRWGKGGPWKFDYAKADRVCEFIEKLPHIKGEWAQRGERLKLEPWQCFILSCVFGWVDSNGYRRFRTAYTEVARKNAKSTLSSGVGLYGLIADQEAGAEIYSAATTRDQAKIIFDDSKRMARKSPAMCDHFGISVQTYNINVVQTSSKFEALSADGHTLDGLNPHMALIDELHAHKKRDVWDVLASGTGARRQPLLWGITTAGFDRSGICYEQRGYVSKILQKLIEDDRYFGIIYTIDEEQDDWQDPANWRKANPNYGVSVLPDGMQMAAKKAAQLPSELNNFLTKRLDVWVNAATAWINPNDWDRCADESLSIEDFDKSTPCWVGVDLSGKTDMTAVVYLFRRGEHYYVFLDTFLPEVTIEQSANASYKAWNEGGYITETEGAAVDFALVEEAIIHKARMANALEIAFDPHMALYLGQRIAKELGERKIVDIAQNVKTLSPPMKELEALIATQRIHHDGNPVLAWALSNVVAKKDANDNLFPQKEQDHNKIDPAVALLIALSRAMVSTGGGRSIFSDPAFWKEYVS